MASSLHVQAVLKKDAEGLGKMADALGPHTWYLTRVASTVSSKEEPLRGL